MPYRIKDFSDVQAEIRRIGHEQVDRALAALDVSGDDAMGGLHEARRRAKKLRGLARLVRKAVDEDAYRRLNQHFRDTARHASAGRDLEAFIEAYDRLCDRYQDQIDRRAFGSIRAGLTRRLQEYEAGQADASAASVEQMREGFEAGRPLIDALNLDASGFGAVAGGLHKTYRRAHHRLADAAGKPKAKRFHAWRKRVKYHRYHLKLLRDIWPGPMAAVGEEASRLGDLLGDAHDLHELRTSLGDNADGLGNPDDVAAFLKLAAGRQEQLERQAIIAGRRLFVMKPKRLKSSLSIYQKSAGRLKACDGVE